MTDEPLQVTLDVDTIENRIVFADRKKNYERLLDEHFDSKAVVIRPYRDKDYAVRTVRVSKPAIGAYIMMSRNRNIHLNKTELLTNVFKFSLAIFSHNHDIDKTRCGNIKEKLCYGTRKEYEFYLELLERTNEFGYGKEKKPRLNVLISNTQSYPTCCEYAELMGITVAEFNAGILTTGFCMWNGISEHILKDLMPAVELMEKIFADRVKKIQSFTP